MRIARIDGALHKIVPTNLHKRVLYLAHHPRLQGHPGAIRMFNPSRREFYWSFMANDVFDTVRDCQYCAKDRDTLTKLQYYLRLFLDNGPFEFLTMDILGPLSKKKSGKRIILVIKDRYSKLTRVIPMNDTTAHLDAACFLNNWVFLYGIPNWMIIDNGIQFIAQLFSYVCAILAMRLIPITAYQPVKRPNGKIQKVRRGSFTTLRVPSSNRLGRLCPATHVFVQYASP